MIRELFVVIFLVCVHGTTSDEATGRPLTTHDRIIADGYPSQYFDVITKDGYILQINRIPRGKNDFWDFSRRPVVFLQHGLQSSANAYLGITPEISLAYNLADRGFDVWIGNARGVYNSRRHLFLDPDSDATKRRFWDFSYEEIALNDLPTMIDFVLARTGQQQLHYIGHSQGGTVFLVLNSRMPEYNDKFISAHLLAGVGYQNHFPSNILSRVSHRTDDIRTLTYLLGFVEIFGPDKDGESRNLEALQELANTSEVKFSDNLLDLIWQWQQALEELARTLAGMGSAAVKQYAHYGQNIRDTTFRSFNYGTIGNLLRYGSVNPPEYDIKKITVDMTMHYTLGDILLGEGDVLAMAKDIPNCKVRKVARDDFKHTEFLLAKDSMELVHNYIIDDLIKRH